MAINSSDLRFFGSLLKAFRTRRHLTQQDLAAAVGVHRNAIGRWEQGDVLPASKTVVLELARHLRLDGQETRQLLEASLTALAPHWSVPLPRNPYFTGREEILKTLHLRLSGDQRAVALTQSYALHGLGGIGKTQIALEYAYRYALEYSAVFWIAAETAERCLSSLVHLAEVLHLPEQHQADQHRILTAVQHWLSSHSQWLLIWDNVEDLALLDRFLPTTWQGAIFITTRRQALGTLAQGIDLLPMEHEEGLLFLLRRAKMLEPDPAPAQAQQLAVCAPATYAAAGELVTLLGGLPLALDQAGAYIEETQCSLSAYLELFRAQPAALLEQRGEEAREHLASVSATFALAITATAKRHSAVGDLLRVCALLQAEAIPEELFYQGAACLGTTLEAACHDPLEWNRVVASACAYSLLHRQSEEQTLSMHRLVQAVLLNTMTEAERAEWSRRTIRALEALFPDVRPATEYAAWKQGARLLPHALLRLHQTDAAEESITLASLAHKVGQYLRERGQYAEAEPFFHRAVHIREQVLGAEHPDVATSLNYLGGLYWEQGRFAEAEPLYHRALHIREQALASDHPDVATSLNNLAILYGEQGKYPEAEALYQRALSIREQVLGPDHPSVAFPLCNVATLYQEQGKYEQAEPLYERALRILEQALGSDHPYVAQPLNGLAGCYTVCGKGEQAESFYQRAIRIQEQTLGPDHPKLAYQLKGLADLYLRQGKEEQAESFYQRALCIREQQLGPYNPETAQSLHDLAVFRKQQGQLHEARSLAKRALSIRAQYLGDAHPKTVVTQALYAQLLQEPTRQEEDPGADRSQR